MNEFLPSNKFTGTNSLISSTKLIFENLLSTKMGITPKTDI